MKQLFSSCVLGMTLVLAGCGGGGGDTPAVTTPAVPDTIALQKIDTVVGTGTEAVAGKTATVHYTGYFYDATKPSFKGATFDTSVGRTPISYVVGSSQLIKGFDEGVKGMKEGGKRTVLIPASMGYGATGQGSIPPNTNLVFDIELVTVK